MLAGEHPAGPAEPRRNLVGEEEHVVLAAELLDAREKARWHRHHSGRTLDHGLRDKARDRVGAVPEQSLQLGKTRLGTLLGGTVEAIRMRKRHVLAREE